MSRPKNQVSEQEVRRWADLRKLASSTVPNGSENRELSELDVVAWYSGVQELSAGIDEAIEEARLDGASWVSIAVALGESGDDKSIARVKSRHFKRLKNKRG